MPEKEDKIRYVVVVNDEEQYSIWPAEREIPPGWKAVAPPGTRQMCLALIDRSWTDMRPRSLRLQMDGRSDG